MDAFSHADEVDTKIKENLALLNDSSKRLLLSAAVVINGTFQAVPSASAQGSSLRQDA